MGDPTSRDVLVVGAGLAGARTVAELREAGFDGRIRVLGAEGVPPYDRPPLSKHLLDRTEPAWLSDEIGVDLSALADEVRLDLPARRLLLDGPRPAVLTDDGETAADDVVLATGAHAVRVPGWEPALTLHTAVDAARLRTALTPGSRLVVIGAGWIGAEVAGVAAADGHDVVVVEAALTPLSAVLGEQVGDLTTHWYHEAGVELITAARVTAVRPDGVDLADGRKLPADVVLAAVGARPSTGWLAGALPLGPAGAVQVGHRYAVLGRVEPQRPPEPTGGRPVFVVRDRNGALADVRPEVPGLWAVGDVATRWSPRHGTVPGGHWDGALRGPKALVGHLLGRPVPSPDDDPAPYVFSTQLGHDLALFGTPGPADEVVLRGTPGAGGWTAVWLRDDGRGPTPDSRGIGAVLVVDSPRDVGAARRLFTGEALSRAERGAVADPAVPLRALR